MSKILLSPYLGAVSVLSLSATAIPLGIRADPNSNTGETEVGATEGDGPDGHLNHPWVVAVAVSLVMIILAVAGIVIFVKLRQRRRRQSRKRYNYTRSSDELVAAPEQPYDRVWRGPYASRSSYNRSPSPPSPAHLSEKDKWALTKR